MEIKELANNQRILANKLIEIQTESRELRRSIDSDLMKVRSRDNVIAEELRKAKEIVDTLSTYQKTFKRTSFLNKVFATIIFLFLIFLIWGSFLINSQSNYIEELKNTNDSIIQVLLGDRKFWVDNDNRVKWDLITNIPENIKNSKNKKKGK